VSAKPKPAEPGGTERGEADAILQRARQMEEARRRRPASPLVGLGMFGLVGWSVAVPILAGTALGVWLDGRDAGEGGVSWTLVCLLAGAVIGAAGAWYWITREGSDD
jgi:ATP synthase protein I